MPFSATVRRLLVSCPGDVPLEDLHTVQKTINYWNGIYGPSFGTVVIPISWNGHGVAEFGRHPQETLNAQIVDDCDICIAIFANRLGTPTKEAESGTVEEIERLHAAGRYVAVLRCTRAVDISKTDLTQATRLEGYLDSIRDKSLTLPYSNDAELERRVEAVLAAAAVRDRVLAQSRIDATPPPTDLPVPTRGAEVWPRVDSSGRESHLVLTNTGDEPARNVHFELDSAGGDGRVWQVLGDGTDQEELTEILAPRGGEARFMLVLTFGVASKVSCTVKWEDNRGPQENTATLRLN